MAKIESEITVRVSNAEDLQKLQRNLTKAIHLSNELDKVLKAIQKTKLVITTESSQSGESKLAANEDGNKG